MNFEPIICGNFDLYNGLRDGAKADLKHPEQLAAQLAEQLAAQLVGKQ